MKKKNNRKPNFVYFKNKLSIVNRFTIYLKICYGYYITEFFIDCRFEYSIELFIDLGAKRKQQTMQSAIYNYFTVHFKVCNCIIDNFN